MSRDTQVERIVEALKTEMDEHLKGALNRQEGTEFAFGRACGFHHGMTTALELVRNVLAEDERPMRRVP